LGGGGTSLIFASVCWDFLVFGTGTLHYMCITHIIMFFEPNW